ncbi:putative benomyl methotrexate resistance protein [Botrytis fragariae]|uniref:Putative benomyl methotrexate resistance protein n=1 Tax=Botrytis fragariae TaxID=1964551 RepID=A0A8H6AJX2_9HELO|nr:putative benomyl methotrexate resistance protein [Botrytis fragariae]KAF5868671.1 putative benomyl methotrexate resistance protein [Botrytis fragariae]
MDRIKRVLSRPNAKPYRTKHINDDQPYINENGHLDFGPGDIENPKNWSTARRWYITVISVLLVVNATFASSSPSGCLTGIEEEFSISAEVAALVISVFLLGYCFGPLFWAPLSEFFGRRWIFYISFTLYLAFNFLCAFANNFAALLIGRFITGTMASSPLSNAPGVLADIWGPVERGNAMALFSMMTFAGPALGPVISGFLELKKDWRWNFYVILWLAGITELLMFTIPETLPSKILVNKARRIRALKIPGYENVKAPVEDSDRTLWQLFKVALIRPWQLLVDPISFAVAVYLSVVYALLYMLFTIYPIIFQEKRGWNSGVGELPLIGTIIGAFIGGVAIFMVSSRDRKKLEAGHVGVAEDRLPVAMAGGIIFPITMFWFAWSGNYNEVHWIVPTLGGVFLSTSILLIFVAYLNYLTDTYLMYAASAVAANTVCRSAAGAAAPLFTSYMFDALGVGGGGSLIGGIAILLAPIPFLFYKYGGAIRERSKFAPTPTKRPSNGEDVGNEKNAGTAQASPNRTTQDRTSISSESSSSIASMPASPREDTYHQEGYIEEGMGYGRVALPSDTRAHDAGQLASEK